MACHSSMFSSFLIVNCLIPHSNVICKFHFWRMNWSNVHPDYENRENFSGFPEKVKKFLKTIRPKEREKFKKIIEKGQNLGNFAKINYFFRNIFELYFSLFNEIKRKIRVKKNSRKKLHFEKNFQNKFTFEKYFFAKFSETFRSFAPKIFLKNENILKYFFEQILGIIPKIWQKIIFKNFPFFKNIIG